MDLPTPPGLAVVSPGQLIWLTLRKLSLAVLENFPLKQSYSTTRGQFVANDFALGSLKALRFKVDYGERRFGTPGNNVGQRVRVVGETTPRCTGWSRQLLPHDRLEQ